MSPPCRAYLSGEVRCAWKCRVCKKGFGGPILMLGMAFRQESCVSVPHCGHVWLQAGGCLRWYVFLRPYMKQAYDANGVSFGHKNAFHCEIFTQKFVRMVFVSYICSAICRKGVGGIGKASGMRSQPKTASVCTRVRTSCKCALSAKQACKCCTAQ